MCERIRRGNPEENNRERLNKNRHTMLPHSWNFSVFIVNILTMHVTKNF
jgi:hypothetical protein